MTLGAAVLVAFGVPDRRSGSEGIAAALRAAGLPVVSIESAGVVTKGSRPFVDATGDGRRLFIKTLGSDQRDADLLYRAYRFARLRNVGDTWPAASVIRAVEHQAFIAVMAERAGVGVPRVWHSGAAPAIAEIGAGDLGAAVIAAASPAPGGLGAIEAARGRGLTPIRVPPGLRSRRSSPTAWPLTGCPSYPAGPPCGSCRGEAMSSDVTRAARRAPRPEMAETLR